MLDAGACTSCIHSQVDSQASCTVDSLALLTIMYFLMPIFEPLEKC
jgi:hypothetical protein